jgi:CBS domain-containing protein
MSLKVKDVMATDIITIEAWATAKKAAELMNQHDSGCIVVLSNGRPSGILTERDILERVLLQSKDPGKTRVSYVMSKPLVTVSPQTDIQEAVNIMNERRIEKLPVVEDRHLQGLVSITDITRSIAYFEYMFSSLCAHCKLGKQQADVRLQAL